MKIINHRLHHDDGTPVDFVKTPNVGGPLSATWLVMHYTAGSSARESISWLAKPAAKASAHLVVARDGAITQMVDFNRVAWHAGKSTWKGVVGLNSRSIGIELDNAGRLARKEGAWTAFGRKVPDGEVLEAKHKNESTQSGWARYPQRQLDVALEVARLLVETYGLKDVIGHDDISPGRKQDPGPAFPIESFRAAAMDTGPQPEQPPRVDVIPPAGAAAAPAPVCFRVTTGLNVRSRPSKESEKVAGSPLPAGTLLLCFEDSGDWKRITTREPVNGAAISGWVAAKYLERV
ncbi:MAG TPA: N-acetylmuramoyl-L-alanine amidase [Longimicrobium sp.]|nr:N-acetylmuramoyl-L-alanine amidase [Longimicrobium sp.]